MQSQHQLPILADVRGQLPAQALLEENKEIIEEPLVIGSFRNRPDELEGQMAEDPVVEQGMQADAGQDPVVEQPEDEDDAIFDDREVPDEEEINID